jgi:benzoyl-CoA-dihydrodiol lyase
MENAPITFDTAPDRYRHWKLALAGDIATLTMNVQEDAPLRPGYQLKLNSYDLGVDIELADAVQRLRFEQPQVRCVVVTSGREKVFSAGANIRMLASCSHGFKVNFCKFTNETRIGIEDLSAHGGPKFLAACNGTTAGGGYELALACDEILLVDDGNSAVSLPEVPLLGVLPGTGGLTRLVDKRKIRRDLADIFCTLTEGIRGERAAEWKLVDRVVSKTRWDAEVARRARALADTTPARAETGVPLPPLERKLEADAITYEHLTVEINRAGRTATITLKGPGKPQPEEVTAIRKIGAAWWPFALFRELDDALLHLRTNEEEIGLLLLKSRGDLESVRTVDHVLQANRSDWFVQEVLLFMGRTMRRLDLSARSLFALVEPGSCFAGSLLELALAADRIYMLEDDAGSVRIATTALNGGAFPMTHGPTRLQARFHGEPGRVRDALSRGEPFTARDAQDGGLVTVVADEIDYPDEVRVAVEERASLSPDALTGMEASLRFPGPETMDSRIFGRLSAWQNWIFTRPNATGERGALTMYGKPERPRFDWRRT